MRMIDSTHDMDLAIDAGWIFYLLFMDSLYHSHLVWEISLLSLVDHTIGTSSDLLIKKICTRTNSKCSLIFI